MILGRKRILEALETGAIVCNPAPEVVEATHIDLHLGRWYYVPRNDVGLVNIAKYGAGGCYQLRDARQTGGLQIAPHTLVLAHTQEEAGTTVPNLLPTIETRSTLARWGIAAHISAGYGDPGYCGKWTLEIYNHHSWPVTIPIGARVACITFHEVDGNDTIYTARYNATGADWKPEMMLPRRGNV